MPVGSTMLLIHYVAFGKMWRSVYGVVQDK
jgi:hypothetical protein